MYRPRRADLGSGLSVRFQIANVLICSSRTRRDHGSELAGMVVAYEPVWAAGTGRTAQP